MKADQQQKPILAFDFVEILTNPKTMTALRKSDQDIKAGMVKEVTSIEDLLAEL